MAFNLPNFVGQNYTPDYSGIGDIVSNYFAGKNAPSEALIEKIKAQFAQPQAQADLQSAQLKNLYQQIQNQFAPATSEADIALKNQMAKMYGMGGGGRGGVGLSDLNATNAEIQALNPGFTPEQLSEAANAYANGQTTLSDGTSLAPASYRLQALMNLTYKKGTDVSQRNQVRFASTLGTLFDKADSHSDDAFKFSGLFGKGKAATEGIKAQFGKESPAYDNYLQFKNVDVPTLVSEIVRTSGANSTDSQKATALGATISNEMLTNPKIAKKSWNDLKDLYKTIGTTITKSPKAQQLSVMGGGNNVTSGGGDVDQTSVIDGKTYVKRGGQWYPL